MVSPEMGVLAPSEPPAEYSSRKTGVARVHVADEDGHAEPSPTRSTSSVEGW